MIPTRFAWLMLVVSTVCRSALCTALALMLWAILPNFVGFQSTVVMSGSMSPRLAVGDAVVVRTVQPAQLAAGQVLLFDDPDSAGRLRMHRVMAVEDDGLVTKGDANTQADSSRVPFAAVHGAGFLRIPFAGLPEYWIRTGQPGPLVGAGVLVLVLVAGMRLDSMLEGSQERVRRRHRGAKAHGMHRATAAVAAIVVLGGATTFAAPTSAQATYKGSTATTGGWRSCNDLPRTSISPSPRFYWGYGYGTGTTVADSSSSAFPATAGANPGLLSGTGNWKRMTCEGSSSPYIAMGTNGPAVVAEQAAGAFPGDSTVATWFRTSTKGGVIADFGSSAGSATSPKYDRILYMNTSGQIVFANYSLTVGTGVKVPYTCTTPGSYADNTAYSLVATWSYTNGCTISINGVQVNASKPLLTLPIGASFTGFWRFGSDGLTASGLPGMSTTQAYFKGDLDESQVYDSIVSASTISARGH